MRFCQEYVTDLNGEQAAIRAGYSPKTARFQASDLLTRPNVQEKLAELQAYRAKALEVTAERILAEWAKIAFTEPIVKGLLKHEHKLHALDSAAKHLGMFKERHEVTGKDGAPLVAAEPSKVALVLLNILSRARPEPDEEP
jgi:phage terminase small subunit